MYFVNDADISLSLSMMEEEGAAERWRDAMFLPPPCTTCLFLKVHLSGACWRVSFWLVLS